jgi:hypothetical protein
MRNFTPRLTASAPLGLLSMALRRGTFRSGSARLGRSQKDGLPSRSWGNIHCSGSRPSTRARGAAWSLPLCNREREWDAKTRELVLLAALALICALFAWSGGHPGWGPVFSALGVVAVLSAALTHWR